MKKFVKIFSLLFVLGMSGQAHAIDFNWGVKGGMNLSGNSFKGLAESITYNNKAGFFVGPMAELEFPIGLSIDGSVLYLQRATDFESDTNAGVTSTYRRHSLDIPLYLKYTFDPLKFLGIYAGVGPSFTFDIKSDNLADKLYAVTGATNVQHDNSRLIDNKAQVGLNFTAGVLLFKHLRVGVNYRLPLGNTARETFKEGWNDILSNDFSSKDKMWQLILSVTF